MGTVMRMGGEGPCSSIALDVAVVVQQGYSVLLEKLNEIGYLIDTKFDDCHCKGSQTIASLPPTVGRGKGGHF
jgi:hypothetical protein